MLSFSLIVSLELFLSNEAANYDADIHPLAFLVDLPNSWNPEVEPTGPESTKY